MATSQEELQTARQAHSSGKFAEAVRCCENILRREPDHAGALHLCGAACLSSGRLPEAREYLERAQRVRPDSVEIAFHLGIALQGLHDWPAAEQAFTKTLSLKPDHLEAHCRLAAIYENQSQWDKAAAAYRQALSLAPGFAEVACNLGGALLKLQQWPEAADAFKQAVALKPAFAEAHNGLGVALKNLRQYEQAAAAFNEAIFRQPNHAEAHYNLGNVLQAQEKWPEAIAAYRRAIALNPRSTETLNNLGAALCSTRDFDAAIELHRQAIALQPDHAESHNNLGNALLGLERYDESRAAFEHAAQLRAGYPEALCNIGNVYLAQNRLPEAISAFRRVLQQCPGMPEAAFNESLALMLQGDFQHGLPGYENRWLSVQKDRLPTFAQPRWQGDTPVAGKTILLYCEQGLGDTLQFVRYLPLLAARGARIILQVQKALIPLFAGWPEIAVLQTKQDTPPPFDLHCPLMSLPLAFKTELSTIPAIPYLESPAEKTARWQMRLSSAPRPRIGLVCSGNPKHKNDQRRSIPLAAFQAIARAAGNPLYLVQKDLRPADATTLAASNDFVDLSAELKDFSDTAAILANLDLLISVDTSLVHLAGALGKPVWTLLPFAPDWRWMLDREDSPWYPTMRLFRQPAPGDWASVLSRVAEALHSWKQP